MKNYKIQTDDSGLRNNLAKWCIYSFAVCLYLPMIFTNILTIILVILWLSDLRSFKIKIVFGDFFIKYSLIFYGLILLGLFYHIPISGILNDLEKKLSLILFPIIFYKWTQTSINVNKLLKLFFYSGFLFSSIACILSIISFVNTQQHFEVFVNHNFSEQIGLHATYLSMYLLFSLTYPIFCYQSKKNQKLPPILVMATILIVLYIILLAVRIIWVILFLLAAYKIVRIMRRKRFSKLKLIALLLCITITSGSVIMGITPIRERVFEMVNYKNNYSTEKVWGGRGMRFLIWKTCLELVKEKPEFGYGSSIEVQNKLNARYKEKDIGPLLYLMNKERKKFNPHNQYLEEVLKFGLILGFIYSLALILLVRYFYMRKNAVGLFLISIIAGVSLTETILELNKGIVFVSFFVSLIYYTQKNKSEEIFTK